MSVPFTAWQPARSRPGMAGNFHLLAQMKVTKAKGLNTIWPSCFGKRVRPAMGRALRTEERPGRRANAFALRVGRAALPIELTAVPRAAQETA
jgi:hypothetical protein